MIMTKLSTHYTDFILRFWQLLSNVSGMLFTLNRASFPSNLGMFQMVDQLHWDAESWFGEQEADITQ